MTAAKLVLEPVFEAQFTEASYGFLPKRSAIDACEAVRVAANQRREWVFEADIRDCFVTIDHEALMAQVARRVVDRPMGGARSGHAGMSTIFLPPARPATTWVNAAGPSLSGRGSGASFKVPATARSASWTSCAPLGSM